MVAQTIWTSKSICFWLSVQMTNVMSTTTYICYLIHQLLPVTILEVKLNTSEQCGITIGEITIGLNSLADVMDFVIAGDHNRWSFWTRILPAVLLQWLWQVSQFEESCANLQKAVKLIQDDHTDMHIFSISLTAGWQGTSTVVTWLILSILCQIFKRQFDLQKMNIQTGDLGIMQQTWYKCLSKLTDIEDSISNL